MIDTIKFLLPSLSTSCIQSVKEYLLHSKKQNVLRDVLIEFYNHSENIGSYNSNISFFYSPEKNTLSLELSLPKFWQGHNVYMLYPDNINLALQLLHAHLMRIFPEFPPLSEWQVVRLDICYNFVLSSNQLLHSYLGVLKTIDYPRHKKYLYDTSVMSVGTSYSCKFYDKGTEFYKHDYSRLVKINSDIAHLMRLLSQNMLRFEVSMRKQYLLKYYPNLTADKLPQLPYIELLSKKLKKYLRYNTTMTTNATDALTTLLNIYPTSTAIKLYMYWQVKHNDISINLDKIKIALNRSTIYRYNRALSKANIGILSNEELPPLSIPSQFPSN